MFLAGSWGADFHPDMQPGAGDTVLLPHKSCDVLQTDLPEHLRRLGTMHLIMAGMSANLCCESTGRHAMEAGFDVSCQTPWGVKPSGVRGGNPPE
ncbi:MAG: cysteine hydrolase family protein, partial [Vicinamibacterales bacterium]